MEFWIVLETGMPMIEKIKYIVDKECMVGDVKALIEGSARIPINDLILVYKNKPLLDDRARLFDIIHPQPPPPAVVTLTYLIKWKTPTTVTVPVTLEDGGFISVVVETRATVGQVKNKIDQKLGVPPSRQYLAARLTGSDSVVVLLFNDDYRLMDVVFHRAQIYLYIDDGPAGETLPIKVVVPSMEGLELSLEMEVKVDTVYTLAAKINKSEIMKQLPYGIKNFCLQIGDETDRIYLVHGEYTLSAYGINAPNFIVYLIPVYY